MSSYLSALPIKQQVRQKHQEQNMMIAAAAVYLAFDRLSDWAQDGRKECTREQDHSDMPSLECLQTLFYILPDQAVVFVQNMLDLDGAMP